MFGILMLLDMALLAYIAYKYTYVDTKEDSNNSSSTIKSEVNSESTDTCSAWFVIESTLFLKAKSL